MCLLQANILTAKRCVLKAVLQANMDHKRIIVRIARPGRLRLLLAERVRVTPVPMEKKQQQDQLHA